MERVPVDQLPVPQREELDRGPVAVDGEPDHVDRPDRPSVCALALGQALDREQAVPVPGRVFEALLYGSVAHLRIELRTIERVSPERKLITPSICAR